MKKIIYSVILNIRNVDAASELRTMLALAKWRYFKQYCRRRSFQEDAEYLGVSKEQLSWFCKKHYGVTFLELRKRLRIQEAVRILLRHPSIQVGELMRKVGENDKSNFRKKFKSETGYSPSEFREIFGLSHGGRDR